MMIPWLVSMTAVIAAARALAPAGDEFAAGLRAYAEGRFADALAAFSAAEEKAGDGAPPELLHDKALAALRAGAFVEAENGTRKAADRGGPEFAALRDFLLGNVAFARCEKAALQAGQVEAEPFAFDSAIALAAAARNSWQRAAASRPDWPEARRNVERALLMMEDLVKRKAEAEKKKPKSARETVPGEDPRPPDGGAGTEEEVVKPEPALAPLSPEGLKRLAERLAAIEKEKLALRRSVLSVRGGGAGKDW